MAHDYAVTDGLIPLCGRYEGVYHRVVEEWDMEEVSIATRLDRW